MFDGVPADQLHQFIAASRTTSSSLPLPLPNIPLSSFPNLQPFDHHPHHYNVIHPHPHPHPPPHDLVQLPQPPPPPPPPHNQLLHPSVVLHRRPNDQEKQDNSPTLVLPPEIERERASSELCGDPWSNDELLALLRIRSTMENWFPEFTWEHVSRKLAEVGFKRSAEKCKEKFEEESRYFNNINFNKNFRFLTELEHLYQPPPPPPPPPQHNHPQAQEQEEEKSTQNVVVAEDPTHQEDQPALESPNDNQRVSEKEEEVVLRAKNNKKRKRHRRFEMLKGFCEDIVNKLMAQQEEIHGKLLEDMVRRDEEKVAKEDAWKKQEMERMNKELETMAHEQAVAGDRQATIIHFLKKLTSSASTSSSTNPSNAPKEPIASSVMVPKSTTSTTTTPSTPTSLTEAIAPQSPTSSTISTKLAVISSPADQPKTQSPTPERPKTQNPSSDEKAQDLGKRWPRDEVLALINLRCSLFTNVEQQDKENSKDGGGGTAVKAPLWERISQGMSELGYKRNAKRCKEKWENINKYFRKTKDVNKKRSVDSRTCPYFNQLSALYNQGVLLVPPSDHHHHQQTPPPLPPSTENNNQPADDDDDEGENSKTNNNMVQQPAAFDFEF